VLHQGALVLVAEREEVVPFPAPLILAAAARDLARQLARQPPDIAGTPVHQTQSHIGEIEVLGHSDALAFRVLFGP
jgi:hypothetical protein